MSEMQTAVRVKAEGLGIIGKPVVTLLVLLYDSKVRKREGQFALMAFAIGQLTYGMVVLGVYVVYYGRMKLWPKRVHPSAWTQV